MENHLSIVQTSDGSKTIYNQLVNENYHSKHGALQESKHVFLRNGLIEFIHKNATNSVSILEVGFGTGLNFLLSADDCLQNQIQLNYTGIEAFPLPIEVIKQTAYEQYVSSTIWESFLQEYDSFKKQSTKLAEGIYLKIIESQLLNYHSEERYDVIYFDAFAKIHQPEMWDITTIEHTISFLKPKGIFVTYAITGDLKRMMQSLGMTIEKLPGALGKREMLRAYKN